ncbi:MAG: OmpA family protein [Gammaproteobacteria bacterium]
MPENTPNRHTPCPLWIWAILLLGLILLYLLYSHATSEKALEIQQDIQTRISQSLLESEQTSAVKATTNGRDVTLKGSVISQETLATAEKIAKRTVGVRQVINQLTTGQQEVSPESDDTEAFSSAKLEPMPDEFAPLPALKAKVEALPDEFAPLEDEVMQKSETVAIEQAQKKFNQLDFSNITFEKNSVKLTPIAQQTLDNAAKALLENPSVKISVDGHTDSSGNPELNLNISKQRAKSVLDYLVSTGVDATRIDANGFGDQFPVAPNETKAGRIKNRRIEIKVKNGE